MEESNAWSVIALGDKRQYGGNVGYAYDLRRSYRFDSSVANHKRVRPGDIVFVRNSTAVLGIARIEKMEVVNGSKERRRCPVCQTPHIKHRQRAHKKWRCKVGHEFDVPISETVAVTVYEAHYGNSFSPAPDALTVQLLKSAANSPNDQHSIERIDFRRVESILLSTPSTAELTKQFVASITVGQQEGDDLPPTDGDTYTPSAFDSRDVIVAAIKRRRGQTKFRKQLIVRYASSCLVTGCNLLDLLEAAHIWPYRGTDDHHPENGLLLRADIHTLFDLNLPAVEPYSHIVRVRRRAQVNDYAILEGRILQFPNRYRPSSTALEMRWKVFASQ